MHALLSISSGKHVTILNNGSVLATGLPVHGIHDRSSQWYLHSTTKGYRYENVQNRDHCLAVAHRNNVTLLVAHNLSETFTLEMMMEKREYSQELGRYKATLSITRTTLVTIEDRHSHFTLNGSLISRTLV